MKYNKIYNSVKKYGYYKGRSMKVYLYLRFVIALVVFIGFAGIPFSQSSGAQLFYGAADRYEDVIVDEVLTVDTFRLNNGERIRLIGVRAPKELTVRRKKRKQKRDKYGFVIKEKEPPFVPFNEKSINFVRELVEGKHLRLEFDVQKKDDKYVTLAYAFLLDDNTFINTEILRQGIAYLSLGPVNKKYERELRAAYQEARKELRGLHGQ